MESFKKFSNCFVTCFPSPRSRGQLWSRKLPMMRSGLVEGNTGGFFGEILEILEILEVIAVIGWFCSYLINAEALLLSKHFLAPVSPNEAGSGRICGSVVVTLEPGQAMPPCQALRAFRRCLHTILCDERVLDIVGASEISGGETTIGWKIPVPNHQLMEHVIANYKKLGQAYVRTSTVAFFATPVELRLNIRWHSTSVVLGSLAVRWRAE